MHLAANYYRLFRLRCWPIVLKRGYLFFSDCIRFPGLVRLPINVIMGYLELEVYVFTAYSGAARCFLCSAWIDTTLIYHFPCLFGSKQMHFRRFGLLRSHEMDSPVIWVMI